MTGDGSTSNGSPVPILLASNAIGQGGGERQLALTAIGLDRSRFEPHVAFCQEGHWLEPMRAAGVKFHKVGPRGLWKPSGIREIIRLRSYIRRQGIRIVQTFDYSANLWAIPAALLSRRAVSIANLRCHMHLIPPQYRWLNQLANQLADASVVNSQALKTVLTEDYSVSADRVFVCHNGYDPKIFHRQARVSLPGTEGASIVVGTVCVLRPEKNLRLLIDAFRQIAAVRPELRLVIVGSGPEEQPLRRYAADLCQTGRAVFLPGTRSVAAALAGIDIFVLPSVSEGLSNALMEAMACGCTVVASDVGGNPELIEDNKNGLLFPGGDRPALERALAYLIDSPERRSILANEGARSMLEGFTHERALARMEAIYMRLLAPANALKPVTQQND